jgi:thiol-disulfide isomerase/thioredoxin
VVLDFWGSWCGWCIKGIPQMKEYYAKYNAKMEILGIDCNDTDQKWKDAVAKYELPWKHVYHPKDGEVTTLYAIQGYPTKIVIDPQGNIAKVVVGEDPAFYTYLDELLK